MAEYVVNTWQETKKGSKFECRYFKSLKTAQKGIKKLVIGKHYKKFELTQIGKESV